VIITIDGPTASGKSSVAKALAEKLGWYYLNTGMLYRAVTHILLTTYNYTAETLTHVAPQDLQECTNHDRFTYHYDPIHGVQVLYDDSDISSYLKDALIDQAVCLISPQPYVRETMSEFQRELAAQHDMVTDGRDTGSVVFPQAAYKFFLTASLDVRAHRWQKDQNKRGHDYSLEECKQRVAFRDAKDQERGHSPLVVPQGGIIIDNSTLDLSQTVDTFLGYVQR
jgi:cytidylate kinase